MSDIPKRPERTIINFVKFLKHMTFRSYFAELWSNEFFLKIFHDIKGVFFVHSPHECLPYYLPRNSDVLAYRIDQVINEHHFIAVSQYCPLFGVPVLDLSHSRIFF